MEAIGLGCLGLQRYASENWTFHILKYTEFGYTELSPEAPLIQQLLQLAGRHKALSQRLKPNVAENVHILASIPVTDVWVRRLGAFPEICDLIGRVHSFRDIFSAQQVLQGPGM